MRAEDFPAFRAIIEDLCTAFDRPFTDARVRVFHEALKHAHILDVKRAADTHRKTAKRFPTPKDLLPTRSVAPKREEPEPHFSKWAQLANRILWLLQFNSGRGMKPIGKWKNPDPWRHGMQATPLDDTFARVLAAKADYVRMAEEAEAEGREWTVEEFVELVRPGLGQIIAESDAKAA